jgi:AcrR family transcriptional regulator
MESATKTARARARAAVLEDIKASARQQMALCGAAALSVRHVARELGMSSSGFYRYFASRDELLTALIIDAYNALGSEVERAEAAVGRSDLFGRWMATARSVRSWAAAHPQEYALVFGSPVPGYAAPQDTVGPAARVPLVLAGILADHWHATHEAAAGSSDDHVLGPKIREGLSPIAGIPEPVITRGVLAWAELFGLVSFELYGHLVGTVADPDAFFTSSCERIAAELGVTPR